MKDGEGTDWGALALLVAAGVTWTGCVLLGLAELL
jgi:hypothetical protein